MTSLILLNCPHLATEVAISPSLDEMIKEFYKILMKRAEAVEQVSDFFKQASSKDFGSCSHFKLTQRIDYLAEKEV